MEIIALTLLAVNCMEPLLITLLSCNMYMQVLRGLIGVVGFMRGEFGHLNAPCRSETHFHEAADVGL